MGSRPLPDQADADVNAVAPAIEFRSEGSLEISGAIHSGIVGGSAHMQVRILAAYYCISRLGLSLLYQYRFNDLQYILYSQ